MWVVPWLLITLVGGTALGLGMYLFDEWREKKRIAAISTEIEE